MEFPTQTTFYRRIRIRILVSELSASEFQHDVSKGSWWLMAHEDQKKWEKQTETTQLSPVRYPLHNPMETKCSARLGALCDTHCENSLSLSLSPRWSSRFRRRVSLAHSLARSLARLRETTKSAASSSCGCDQQAFIQLLLNRALEILQNHQTRAGGKKREGYYWSPILLFFFFF